MRKPAGTARLPGHRRSFFGALRSVLVPIALAALGTGGAPAASGAVPACQTRLGFSGGLWAAADFNGDNSIDLAHVRVWRDADRVVASRLDVLEYCRYLPLPDFDPFALVLSARDLDADDDPDLVLRDPLAERALGIWLNDGTGGFAEAEPSQFAGAGSDPPAAGKPTRPVRGQMVSWFSSSGFSLPSNAIPFRLARGSAGGRAKVPIRAVCGCRDPRQSRAPPWLSV